MVKREYTCIVCPVGCRLCVTDEDGKLSVTGNSCKRGEAHALSEYRDPTRMLTSTVKLAGAYIRRLPVISTAEIPRRLMDDCLKKVYAAETAAPVTRGDVIISDICGTGVDIVAARTIN